MGARSCRVRGALSRFGKCARRILNMRGGHSLRQAEAIRGPSRGRSPEPDGTRTSRSHSKTSNGEPQARQ